VIEVHRHHPATAARIELPENVVDALRSFAQGTRRYLLVSTVFGLIVAVIDTIVLWMLGIPLPLLWGLLAFITNYIPNVGFIIGLIPPTIVALLDHDPKTAIAVVVIYCVLNIIIQSVIQPRVVGSSVGLAPTLSFLSLIVWAAILGGVGAFLAVPASLFVKALFVDVDPDYAWLGPLLSGDTPEAETVDDAESAPTDPETETQPAG